MENNITVEQIVNKLHPEGFIKRSEFHSLDVEQQIEYLKDIVDLCGELGMPLKIGFANEKGGTGKTTIALNVAYMLGQFGIKTLLQDNDPQASATTLTGADKEVTKNVAFAKRLNDIPEVEEIYKDLDNFQPIDLINTDINKEFDREYVGYSIDDALTSMIMNDGVVDQETLDNVVMTPMYVTQVQDTDENGKKKRDESGKIIWKDTLVDYGFDLIPSSSGLFTYGVNMGIVSVQKKLKIGTGKQLEACMEQILEHEYNQGNKYGIVVCDLAPSLDIVTLNGINFCKDGIIGVITANFEVINGIFNIMSSIKLVVGYTKDHSGMPLIITNRYTKKNKLDQIMTYDLIQKTYKLRAAQNRISNMVGDIQKAHNSHLLLCQASNKAYEEFKKLTAEVLYEVIYTRIERDKKEKE